MKAITVTDLMVAFRNFAKFDLEKVISNLKGGMHV